MAPAPASPAGLGPEKDPELSAPSGDDTASSSAATLNQPPPPTTTITPTTTTNPPDAPLPEKNNPDAPSAPAEEASTPLAPEETRTSLQTTAIILALASALFLAALDVTIVTVAVPTIALEFRSTAGYTWIGSAYMLATAAAAPMWGKVSDIWGRKPVMLIAVGVFWVGSLLSAVSRSMGMLIVARAVQGVGGGGIVILVNVCISDLFSMRKRGEFFLFCFVSGGFSGGHCRQVVTRKGGFWVLLTVRNRGVFWSHGNGLGCCFSCRPDPGWRVHQQGDLEMVLLH